MEVNLHLASTEIKQDYENQALNFRLSSNEHLMAEVFFNGRKIADISVYLLELSTFGEKCSISIFPRDEQKAACSVTSF